MNNKIADHFAKLLFNDDEHRVQRFTADLSNAVSDQDYNHYDMLFDIRTGIVELQSEFEQDISNSNEERVSQMRGLVEKIRVAHKLGFRDDLVFMCLNSRVMPVSGYRKLLNESPEEVIRKLAINTNRMSVGNFTYVGTDTLHLSLIDTFPEHALAKAKLPDKYLKLLFKLTDRTQYLSLMNNQEKRALLDNEMSI